MRFAYTLYHPVTGVYLGQLPAKNPQWVETVNGSGTFTCRVVVPEDEVRRDYVRQATALDNSLHIEADNGVVPWFGYILKRKWLRESNELEITAVEWRSYLYRVLVAPFGQNSRSNTMYYTNVDQLEIARQVVLREVVNGVGLPPIMAETPQLSGVLRTVLVDGRKFASLGETIDAIANDDRGFEWDILPVLRADGTATKKLEMYFPERGSTVEGLEFRYGVRGNILDYEDLEESNEQLVRRQWAIGEGPSSDLQSYAYDDDPNLISSQLLRFDKVTQWQGATSLKDLASKARGERMYYGIPFQMLSFSVSLNTPHAYTYAKGDRCRLVLKDRWLDLEYNDVRIIERKVSPDDNRVQLVVDLNDQEVLGVDEQGAV